MNAAISPLGIDGSAVRAAMESTLDEQRRAFREELPVSLAARIDRIDRAIALLKDHQDDLVAAMDEDFGGRPRLLSKMTDVAASIGNLKYARKNAARWMRRSRRKVRFPLNILGAKAWVEYQPKGVVGLISPWNYPVMLTFGPLGGILAAGNRVMIKPSEHTPKTSDLMATLISQRFDKREIAVFGGDAFVAQEFSSLPFDHMLFTGSTSVGRHIMRAASANLTPVTLELGGKSPTVIGESADLAMAAERIVIGKMMNAGQTCLAPDYLLVQSKVRESFIEALKEAAKRIYPTVSKNEHYAQVVNEPHFDRLQSYLDEAEANGVEVHRMQQPGTEDRRMPLTIATGAEDKLALMREEIFGPILPILSFDEIDEVIARVTEGERPLALYYFGQDKLEERALLDKTHSGGVTLNDVVYHITCEDLPFGGTGASGMGAYHGPEGFIEFSHAKAVFRQPRLNLAKLAGLIPPYGKRLAQMLKMEMR